MEESRTGGTTAISTVAVDSGNTRIVIALLKYKDWLELKVVEVTPALTHLGESLEEALDMKQTHDDVIRKIQSKTSPVEELYKRAGEVMSKECRPEVYAAMADSLSLVWQNINSHLESRKQLLQLNVDYFRYAGNFEEKCSTIESLCKSDLPVEINEMQTSLSSLKEMHREMLVLLSNALYQGNLLLQMVTDICDKGTLDSRPAQIKVHAELAKLQVERWLEGLHSQRHTISTMVESRTKDLSQCLGLALITADLTLLRRHIAERTESLSGGQLGDAYASAQLLLHEHMKLLPEAKEFQDQALKIVKATEEFASEGHFAGPEAISEAYNLLDMAATYIHLLDSREALLNRAINFFNQAQSALLKLDQLEMQIRTGDIGLSEVQLSQLHQTISQSLDEVTSKPLELGYNILQEIPSAEGVKRNVELIENKKINLNVQCTAHKEENIQANKMYNNFIEKYNQLNAFITSMQTYLTGMRDMGSNLLYAKDFLQAHKTSSTDLQMKSSEVNALLSVVPATCEVLDPKRSEQVCSLSDFLRSSFTRLVGQLENRSKLASLYLKLMTLGQELQSHLDKIESIISKEEGDESDGTQIWFSCRQQEAQLSNTVNNFVQDIKLITLTPPVDGERAIACAEELLERLANRRKLLDSSWTKWLDDRAASVRNQANWDRVMAASTKTVDWVSKLDAQLYPILNKEIHSARQLACHVEHKINTVLPEIRRAQQEIQLRIETAESLISKGDVKGREGIPVRLKELSIRLQSIATDYQVLLEKLLTFFNSISQVETKIEMVQKEQMTHIPPHSLQEAENNQRTFESTRHTITEMMNLSLIDSGHIINKIRALETNSTQDIMTVERAVETLRYDWQKIFSERERTLERDMQRCQFDADLSQINASIDQLSRKLHESRGRHGDDLPSAKAALLSFVNFEHTIKLLDEKILCFIQSGEDMLIGVLGDHVERELAALQRKWQLFKQQVLETRNNIDIAIKYFSLVEEAQDWFQEGNRLLISIIQQITYIKSVEEATRLLQQIDIFLKPGEEKQQLRIDEISRLAEKMQSLGPLPHVSLVKSENKEMINSFSQVTSELKTLLEKLDRPELKMEIDDVDKLQIKFSEPPVNTSSSVTSEFSSSAFIQEVKIHKEHIVTESVIIEGGDIKKSPTPPAKKLKYVEVPKLEAPYFKTPLRDVTIQEGSKLKFDCSVTGVPLPEIMWEKDGLSIDNNPDYLTTYKDGTCTLTIEETFVEDSSRFTCRASNEAGSAETSAFLTVKEIERETEVYPPVFISPLAGVTVKEGETLELRCHVQGLPLPIAQWTKDSKNLDNDPTFTITFNNGEAVAVKNKSEMIDQGSYTCTANNPHGSQSSTASVHVNAVKPSSEAPKFVLGLDNVMARAGQKIKLECEAIGVPLPQITWTQDCRALGRDSKVTVEGGKSTLLIAEAFLKDAGTYTAVASNVAGSASTSALVTVKGRLPNETSDSEMTSDVEPVKPTIQLPLKDLSVFEGKKLRLDCVIVGQPEPEVIWYHNERPVKESPDVQLLFQGDRCSLIIKEAFLEDAGNYRVVAINSAGEASSSCKLAVQAVDRSTEGASRQPAETENSVIESNDKSPFFTHLLNDVFAVQGETVVLECSVGGIPPPTVTWYLNNSDVQQSERIHMIQSAEGDCSLRISGVLPEDRGVYTARATNQQGEAKCFSHLNVKAPVTTLEAQPHSSVLIEEKHIPPAFSELFADKSVAEGASAKFECIVTGKPAPKVRWLYNHEPVSGKDFLVSTSGNRQVLLIPTTSKSLAGKVSCVAENEAGKATCEAQLRVTDSMIDVLPLMENISSSKESSVFEMKRSVFSHSSTSSQFSSSSAQPHVEIKSMSSQSEMSAHKIGSQPTTKVESHKVSEYTNIDGVESRQDSEFLSKSGDAPAAIKPPSVPIDQPPKIIKPQRKSMPPRFITPLTGCIVDQGADVILEAVIEGFPTPSVSWSKNSTPLPDNSETTWKLNRAVLKLSNVTPNESGRYSITAANEAGTAGSTADLVVKKTSFPPVMGRRLRASTALLGERVAMEIEVTGTPTPTVTWFKDGQTIPPSSNQFRLQAQGNNCFSLIIDKADFSHSGQYAALATNCAGEAKSTADLLVIEPQNIDTSLSDERLLETKQESSRFGESILKPMLPSFVSPGKEAVTVSENFSSEKTVSMKVEHSSVGFDTVISSSLPKAAEKVVRFEDKPAEVQESYQKKQSEVIEESASKQSALDFFKTIIKENEEESKKVKAKEIEVPVSSWKTNMESSSIKTFQDIKPFRTDSIEYHDRPLSPEFHLEPGPPPEMGYIPKMSVPKAKDDMMDRVKKLQESHRELSESEIPSGGVQMYPIPIKKDLPKEPPHSPVETVNRIIYPERKKSVQMDYSHKKEVIEDVIIPKHIELPGMVETSVKAALFEERSSENLQGPVMRPSADINVRPLSPRPSAEGVSMEKLWSSIHKENHIEENFYSETSKQSSFQGIMQEKNEIPKPIVETQWTPIPIKHVQAPNFGTKSVSPFPSYEGLHMEKQWGHKTSESKLKTVWPPPSSSHETSSVESKFETSFTSSTDSRKSENIQPLGPTIFYVAEAHATHRANMPSTDITKTISTSTTENISHESSHSEERNILPSQAKKLWPQGPPISFETRGFSKLESKFLKRSNSQELALNDVYIEPGPPPEIGYASPSPRERRQSYVEAIEQDLAKDLEKEPSRHLVGAVRTIPPPFKKERSVEPQPKVVEKVEQKSFQRSSSLVEEFKPFPELEPFPFKVETIKEKVCKYGTVPLPSKFVKKLYSESDYESDIENTRIKARWTPWDSDVEEPTYRRVKPPEAKPRRPHSVEPEPLPPSKFDMGPIITKSATSFTSEKQFKRFESETKSKSSRMEHVNGFSLKPGSPPEYLPLKKPDIQPDSPKIKKRSPFHESGYMADTDEPRKFFKQTKSTIQQSSQWRSERNVSDNYKLEKKALSPKIEKEMPQLEPFPFKVEPAKPVKRTTEPPASPSKFVKGEFRESDYESDYEGKIKAVWRPRSVEPKDPTFRPVKPVLQSEPKEEKRKVKEPTPPSQFDKPPSFESLRPTIEPVQRLIRPEPVQFGLKPGSPPKMDFAPPPRAMETSSSMSFSESTESSRRVVSMQQTTRVISFDQQQKKNVQKYQTLPHKFISKGDAKWASATDSESDTTKKEMSGLDERAEELRLQRIEDMRRRFGEKTSQSLVELKPAEPPTFDYAPPKVPPVASSIANKQISEMTSSFKSKAQKFSTDIIKDVEKNEKLQEKDSPQCYREETRHSEHGAKHIDPDTGLIYFKYDFGYEFGVVMPGEGVKVKAIKEDKDGSIEVPVIHERTSQARVGWTSESELSEAEERRRPKVTIPITPSPRSLSPSIPSLSPYAHPIHDSSGLGGWAESSPKNVSSPVVVNAMLHSDQPKKPPAFITPLRDIAVVSGQSGRFECIVQAEPMPNVLWTKDGRIIEPSLNHEIMFRNGVCRLTIHHVFSDDQGLYKCTATNNVGTSETVGSLTVSGEARTYIV